MNRSRRRRRVVLGRCWIGCSCVDRLARVSWKGNSLAFGRANGDGDTYLSGFGSSLNTRVYLSVQSLSLLALELEGNTEVFCCADAVSYTS
jgi:hypothetical protein